MTFSSQGVPLEISVVRIFSVIIVTASRTKTLCSVRRMFMGFFLLFYVETAIIYLNDVKQTVCILGTQCLWGERERKWSFKSYLDWTEASSGFNTDNLFLFFPKLLLNENEFLVVFRRNLGFKSFCLIICCYFSKIFKNFINKYKLYCYWLADNPDSLEVLPVM